MEGRIRVLCVDDNPEITLLYSALLEDEHDMECVGTLASAEGLLDKVRETSPDVVLLDLTMPGPDPLAAISELRTAVPDVRVLLCSGHDDPATVRAGLDAGAWGLVPKHLDPEVMLKSVRSVARGEVVAGNF